MSILAFNTRITQYLNVWSVLACQQALQDSLAARWEMQGELATTSLEFECLHWKSWCKMLIDGDDISIDVITLGKCFSMFVYICAPFCFPIWADWRKSDSSVHREPQGNCKWNSNSRDIVASSPSFPCPAAKALRRACSGLQRDLNLWPGDTSANCSNQLSHEATDVGTWSIMCSKCSRERGECEKCISNKSYIKTAEMKSNEEWPSQLWTQFMQLHKKPEKNSGRRQDLNPWPCDTKGKGASVIGTGVFALHPPISLLIH